METPKDTNKPKVEKEDFWQSGWERENMIDYGYPVIPSPNMVHDDLDDEGEGVDENASKSWTYKIIDFLWGHTGEEENTGT